MPALRTLPDLLRPGLDLVFVGMNPGERSARLRHYYAHPGNAFWPALSASPLAARSSNETALTPEDDRALPARLGIGFTDPGAGCDSDRGQQLLSPFGRQRGVGLGFRSRDAGAGIAARSGQHGFAFCYRLGHPRGRCRQVWFRGLSITPHSCGVPLQRDLALPPVNGLVWERNLDALGIEPGLDALSHLAH